MAFILSTAIFTSIEYLFDIIIPTAIEYAAVFNQGTGFIVEAAFSDTIESVLDITGAVNTQVLETQIIGASKTLGDVTRGVEAATTVYNAVDSVINE